MVTASFIQWDVTAGSLLIFGGLMTLAGMFLQFSRVGSQTVQVLQVRADTLDEELADARDNLHQAELQIKDREAQIAELSARPDTEKVYLLVQQHHEENQQILNRLADAVEKGVETQAAAMQMLTVLVDRNRDRRTSDAT